MGGMVWLSKFKGRVVPVLAGLALTAGALLIQVTDVGPVAMLQQRLDAMFYDIRLNALLDESTAVDDRIVIIDIDEKSLQQEGHWPWRRARLADLSQALSDAGAVVTGFDVIFSEAEHNPVTTILDRLPPPWRSRNDFTEALKTLADTFDGDTAFANVLSTHDVVLGFLFHNIDAAPAGYLPPSTVRVLQHSPRELSVPALSSYTSNLVALGAATGHAGFTTTLFDSDGILRRSPLLLRYGDTLYPSLALEMARLYLLADEIVVATTTTGAALDIEYIALGGNRIPTDSIGRAIIPFTGPAGRFRYISAADVLERNIENDALAGKIALVGTTALGLSDLVSTPVQSAFPGVEVHATLLSGILDNRFPVEPSWTVGASITTTVFVGILAVFWFPLLGPLSLLMTSTSLITALVTFNTGLWITSGLVLPIALPVVLIVGITTFSMAYGFVIERRRRTELKSMFGQYVPAELVNQMTSRSGSYAFNGESREMTVLFADIQNFTSISEQLPPAKLKELLNLFFTCMTRVIFDYHGTIDKYVGDMIMAFWGAPIVDDHHAGQAIEAALKMLEKLDTLGDELAAAGLPRIRIGIGINTGIMNVGDMGSEFRRAYTVVGDNVNLASRIEGLTRYYGVDLIVGENTRKGQHDFIFRQLDRVRVKGKTVAVQIYQPLCRINAATPSLLADLSKHNQAFEHYLARQWSDAARLFTELADRHPDTRLYGVYLERITQLQGAELNDSWDGVFDRRGK